MTTISPPQRHRSATGFLYPAFASPPELDGGSHQYIHQLLQEQTRQDIITIFSELELFEALQAPFSTPILFQGWREPRHSLDHFLARFEQRAQSRRTLLTTSVHDYSIVEPSRRTTTTTVKELIKSFRTEATGFNYLDIENRDGRQFAPHTVRSAHLQTQLTGLQLQRLVLERWLLKVCLPRYGTGGRRSPRCRLRLQFGVGKSM